jgi:hypothetical protein
MGVLVELREKEKGSSSIMFMGELGYSVRETAFAKSCNAFSDFL